MAGEELVHACAEPKSGSLAEMGVLQDGCSAVVEALSGLAGIRAARALSTGWVLPSRIHSMDDFPRRGSSDEEEADSDAGSTSQAVGRTCVLPAARSMRQARAGGLPSRTEELRGFLASRGRLDVSTLSELSGVPRRTVISLLRPDTLRRRILKEGQVYEINPDFDAELQSRLDSAAGDLRYSGFQVTAPAKLQRRSEPARQRHSLTSRLLEIITAAERAMLAELATALEIEPKRVCELLLPYVSRDLLRVEGRCYALHRPGLLAEHQRTSALVAFVEQHGYKVRAHSPLAVLAARVASEAGR